MSLASGSLTSLVYIPEVTWGVTPDTGNFKQARYTGVSMKPNANFVDSKEIRSDRQTADSRQTAVESDGDFDSELIVEALDDFLELAMLNSWNANKLHIGTTRKSVTLEQRFPDIGKFFQMKGVVCNTFALSAKPKEIVTAKFGLMGKDFVTASSTVVTTDVDDPTTNSPCDTFQGVITEGGTPIAILTALDLTLSNGYEGAYALGQKNLVDMVPGRADITGKMTAYFKDLTLMDKFLNETESSLEVTFIGLPTSKKYKFTLPRVKFTGGEVPVTKEGLLALDMSFKGLVDANGDSLIVERILA